MRQQYEAQGVGFLAVSIEPDRELVRSAVSALGISMQVGISENETLGPLSVRAVPSTVFVNEQGIIVAAASGARDRGFFERRVQALLEK